MVAHGLLSSLDMIKRTRSSLGICTSLLSIAAIGVGCSGSIDKSNPDTAEARGHLQPAQSCGDLESLLKQDAAAKMNAQIDAIIADIEANGGYYYGGVDGEGPGGVAVGSGVGGSNSTGSGESGGGVVGGSAGGGGASPGGNPAPGHSETNTQVAGVDEADILKTDGNFIYLLHGQTLQVLQAWPASGLAIANTTAIEGNPIEMFVTEDELVIYSQVDGTDVYTAAGVQPRSYYSYGPYGSPGYDGYYNPYYAPLTKITVLGLNAGQPSAVQKEVYFEGSYASSRRINENVHTILSGGQHGPSLNYYPNFNESIPQTVAEWTQAFENLRFENSLAIFGSTLTDWLPYRFERTNGNVNTIAPNCESYYVPSEGSTNYGLVSVESFALTNLAAPLTETNIVAGVDTVYSSNGSLYLAAQGYRNPTSAQVAALEAVDTTETFIHKFDLTVDPATPEYVATGAVPGRVKNQFSMDERDGKLRVTTTRDLSSQTEWTTSNGLYVLTQIGPNLDITGRVEDLAMGETIYSTRMIGTRAYMVTFRQVDPLFVIDLADQSNPTVVAELKIPGFSEYMHPLDDQHLLTIGQDATADGQVQGLALQVFDVTNPQNPTLMHKYAFSGTDYGFSEAQYNHKAFNWYAPLNLLAFPFSGYDSINGTMRSSLELFDVTLAQGIQKRASINHSAFFNADPNGYCNGYYGVDVRRGVFIDNYVYAISYGGVTVSNVMDPLDPLASVALSTPAQPYGYCGL